MKKGIDYEKNAGSGWLIAGYIFALLGGLIGIWIGSRLLFGKVKLTDGTIVKTYDESSRTQGTIILVLAIISIIVWNVVARS
jgi:hypothetical protein